jgi:putative ABC transport system substrate-binding protein
MRRIGLVLALALGLIVGPPAGEAQQTGKVYRVGVLVPVASSAATDLLKVLRQGLRELGYVEGRNLAFELRYAQTAALMAESAADLARLNVDVIVASTTMPALAAKRATSTIPIVMVASADPGHRDSSEVSRGRAETSREARSSPGS